MNLRENGCPEACYFACPEVNFRKLEAHATALENDVASVSQYGAPVLREELCKVEAEITKALPPTDMPADGPWRLERDVLKREGLKRSVLTSRALCCRFSGVVVFGSNELVTLKRL
jgi:hypothetical protein